MEITDLRTFLEVASGKRVTAAGRELNTVPSNVTTRIKKLEEEIGLPLFDRHSRGMILTEAGQRLLPYAENLVTLLREAKEAAQDNGVVRGALRIGSMETTAAVRLPPLLARFHRDCPQVKFTLVTGPTAHLVDEVVARRLDGAFVAGPIQHPDLDVVPAFSEELVLVTAPAIDTLEALRHSASGGLTALMFRLGCSYRQRLEQVLAGMGLPAFSRIELGTLDGLLGCIAAGIGVTLLPRAVVTRSNYAGSLKMHALPAEVGRVATLLAIRRDKRVGAALRSFIGIVGPSHAPVAV